LFYTNGIIIYTLLCNSKFQSKKVVRSPLYFGAKHLVAAWNLEMEKKQLGGMEEQKRS
jgi:hypothetical protein